MTNNLALWEAVEKTPQKHTKDITGKSYNGTSPKPYYLVQKATETFGPCGIGWGFEIVDERIEEGAGGEKLSIARVKVWYVWDGKRGEVEHIGGTTFSGTRRSGQAYTDEDAPKKSVTDALVKALSMIGFAGDIFMGRYDDSKYVQQLKDEERQNTAGAPSASRGAVAHPSPKATAPTITADQAAVIEAVRVALTKCELATDVAELRQNTGPAAKKAGVTQGSLAATTLAKMFADRLEEIEAAEGWQEAAE